MYYYVQHINVNKNSEILLQILCQNSSSAAANCLFHLYGQLPLIVSSGICVCLLFSIMNIHAAIYT